MSSSDYIAIAGVAANLLVALVAVAIPVWQRRAMLEDASRAERKSWSRFIDAFRALAAAQDAMVAAASAERTNSTKAFAEAEAGLRGALAALAESSAHVLPVGAAMNAAKAQMKAEEILRHFPDLRFYGSNLLTIVSVAEDMKNARIYTHHLLKLTEHLKLN